MYKLDRVRRVKILLGALILIFLALFLIGLVGPRYRIIFDDFMNEQLYSITKVCSLFSAVLCLVGLFIINALEEDIAEWLGILDKEIMDNRRR